MRLILFAVLLLPFLSTIASAAPPRVLATIKPIHSLVAAVMDGVASPELLIAGAASEHTYVLKPSDAAKLAAANVVFWVGPDLETFLSDPLRNLAAGGHIVALEKAPGLTLYAAREGGLWPTPAEKAQNRAINPHIWLDPDNAAVLVREIAAVLAAQDPADAARYRANAAAQIARLSALDAGLRQQLAAVQGRPFLVYHDAYPYFTAHYRLDSIGAVTVEPGRPVGPRRVADLREIITAGKAICLFREPQFPPALLSTLANGTTVRIGVLDPIGADLKAGPDLYEQLMTDMAHSFIACLSPLPH